MDFVARELANNHFRIAERFGQPLPSKKFWNRYARVRVAVEGAKTTCPNEEIDTVRFSAFDAPLRIAGDGGYAGKSG
jgi:hypothetical protein